MAYYPLATGMARKFARRKELQPDDYVGAAGLAVVQAVHNAFKYLDDPVNLGKYVVTYIRRAINDEHQLNKVVPIPPRSLRFFYNLGYLVDISSRPLTEDDLNTCWDSYLFRDLEEICDERERKVAHLRAAGYTYKEIESLLSLTPGQLDFVRKRLRKLVKEVLE